jgi:hypothetical protein
VGFGLPNKILPFFPICHQLSPSSLNPSSFPSFDFHNNKFFTVWGCYPHAKPQPGGPGYPFLSGSSPLTCLAWDALPVAYATASKPLGIMWPHKPHHYVKVGIPSGGDLPHNQLNIILPFPCQSFRWLLSRNLPIIFTLHFLYLPHRLPVQSSITYYDQKVPQLCDSAVTKNAVFSSWGAYQKTIRDFKTRCFGDASNKYFKHCTQHPRDRTLNNMILKCLHVTSHICK